MNRLDELLQESGPVGARLLVEQGLSLERISNAEEQVALALEIDAVLFELPIQPLAAVEADANAEGKPGLDSDVTESESFVLEVVVKMDAAGGFFAGFDEAALILAETVEGISLPLLSLKIPI
jgi:hypothetical protein